MKSIKQVLFFLLVVASAAALSFAQKEASPEVLLTVSGEVPVALKLTRADFDKFPRRTVRAKDHDGKEYSYEGVALIEILQKAGVKFGEALRGKALATYLLVDAADGYQAVYSLPELDSSTNERLILVADRQDGNVFPQNAGPLKIIVPGDKTHARWVRQIKSFTIVRAPVK